MKRTPMMAALAAVERFGNKLPHPFWLFCILFGLVGVFSAGFSAAGIDVERPEVQLLRSLEDGSYVDGLAVTIDADFQPIPIDLGSASHSSRLSGLQLEVWEGMERVHVQPVERKELKDLVVSRGAIPALVDGHSYRVHVVRPPQTVPVRSLLSGEGLEWFVLKMVENFSHFEPLGLVLVMLMGVAIAEGAGLIPTAMRAIALAVPPMLVIPVLFALGACGNIGSDAGIVVIPPLSAAIFKQLGRNPIAGLLVGYVGATAGFTANLLPAGTDVLAMSLTNAATGGNPEVNVLCNWYFMVISVFFLSGIGTFVTFRYILPRLGDPARPEGGEARIEPIAPRERKALIVAVIVILVVTGVWLLTVIPTGAPLRNPDPDPDLFWRSSFFKGLIPILFTIFAAGGIAYGLVAGTIKKADDIIEFMAAMMRRMGAYIVLVLAIAQFIRSFQFARLDELIAVEGAHLLRSLGMESMPIPFFIVFVIIIAVANMFMGSASAKWAIFAPIFVPMFMALGFHPAWTQLLYRLGDSITNCVSPLYPFFPILLGWIAEIDEDKAKVGTVMSYLVPYAFFLLIGWLLMMTIWYLLGLPVGPDSPIAMP